VHLVAPLAKVDSADSGFEESLGEFVCQVVALVLLMVSFEAVECNKLEDFLLFLRGHFSQTFLGFELPWVLLERPERLL